MTYAVKVFSIVIPNSAENMYALLWKSLCLDFLMETDNPEVFHCCFPIEVLQLIEMAHDLCF